MKHIFLLLFSLLTSITLFSQVVTSDPAIPIESKAVTIIFDATQGTGGLAGFNGDVYTHTGVITDKSTSGSDWKYVKTSWGQNTPETKLTRIDTDLYALEITPTIRQYYGVPSTETILQMAFVFRSADSSLEGKGDGGADIFVDVFKEGFLVKFEQPNDNEIIEPGETLTITISSTENADLELHINDVLLSQNTGNSLSIDHEFTEAGNFWLVAIGSNGEENKEDTLFVCVREEVEQLPMPEGYKKGVNYLNDESVALVLWAPHKENVFVLGDFNEWRPLNEFQMKKDGDYFWLEIDNLWSEYPYVYQYFIDGSLLLADPYTDQVSDPNNDKHIPEVVYPGLVKYPFSKTNGLASVLEIGQENYPWQVNTFQSVEKEKLVIYELLIRDFVEMHSYDAVIEKLDYLQTLGVNALELMPVNEFEGNSSWGYNPSFYFAPDKYYGPKERLKALVDECHQRGIAVIIDMVLNHSYGQSPFAQMYLDEGKPADNNPWYNREHNFTNPDAHWGYDFNHESIHTQELVDSINAYWMEEYKVDGFRFDFTKGFGNNIKNSSDSWGSKYDADRIRLLKRMSDEIWERNPNALVIFEHLSDNTEEKELANYGILMWGNMNHNYAEGAMGYNTSNKSNLTWGVYKARGWNEANLVSYMESHDEERVMYKISQWGNSSGNYDTKDVIHSTHRIGLNSVFFLPLPGPKMIWQFGELGYDISIDFDCRVCEKPILWEYFEEWQRKNIYDVMANLNHLKNSYDIFSTDDFSYTLNTEIKRYHLQDNNEHVLALGNYAVSNKTTTLTFPTTGTWYDYFSKSSFEVSNLNMQIDLNPGEYKLYSTEEFDWKVDMSPVSVGELKKEVSFQSFPIFPNPATSDINWNDQFLKAEIFDLQGNSIEVLSNSQLQTSSANIESLEAGSYFVLAVDAKGFYKCSKFVKI